MERSIEVNQEFIICRYLNGIKLLPREYFKLSGTKDFFAKPIKSVAEVMQMPFSVFFLGSDFKVKDLNEESCATHNIYSKSDAIGHTVARVTNNKQEITKIHENNKKVMTENQFFVIDESVDLVDEKKVQAVSFKVPWYDNGNHIIGIFGCAVIMHPNQLGSIANHLATISTMFLPPQVSAKNLLAGREINGEYFSPREVDVIQWVIRGKTMREIGLLLGLKTRTVEFYFSNIKEKVGVKTKSHLIERVMMDPESL